MLHDHPFKPNEASLLAERFNVIGWIYISKNQSCSIARRTGYLLCRLERVHSEIFNILLIDMGTCNIESI